MAGPPRAGPAGHEVPGPEHPAGLRRHPALPSGLRRPPELAVRLGPGPGRSRGAAGRVDLAALLAAPLPALGDLQETGAFGEEVLDAATRIAAAVDADPVVVRTQLGVLLEERDPARLQELLARHEGELVYLAYTDPSFVQAVTRPGDEGAFAPEIDTRVSVARSGAGSSG